MGNRLYVGNLSWDTQEDDLIQAFEQDGRSVTSAQIVTDRDTGRSRGFAFVEMANSEDGQSAISGLNGTEISGRQIKVDEARPRRDDGGGGGGRRGGGGGGRGGRGGGGGGYRDRW